MRTPAEQEIALECIQLAVRAQAGDPVEMAEAFFEFVTGQRADDEETADVR